MWLSRGTCPPMVTDITFHDVCCNSCDGSVDQGGVMVRLLKLVVGPRPEVVKPQKMLAIEHGLLSLQDDWDDADVVAEEHRDVTVVQHRDVTEEWSFEC